MITVSIIKEPEFKKAHECKGSWGYMVVFGEKLYGFNSGGNFYYIKKDKYFKVTK